MKKTWLIPALSASAVMALALTAHAEPVQIPGIVYIPTEDITILPSGAAGAPECQGAGTTHSGLGCWTVDKEITVTAYADAATVATDMATALTDFDVLVTNTRPPKYLPYMMLLPSDTVDDMSQSFTCTGGGVDCSALSRRRIGQTIGGSMNCTNNADLLHSVLYIFGRLSGLEGTDPMAMTLGVMSYLPDYTMPQTTFTDECLPIVPQQGFNDRGMQIDLPLDCTQLDHTCDPGLQNSYQDLLATYGPALMEPDTTAPVVEITSPMDGEVFPPDVGELMLDGTITEEGTNYVGVRWTLQSQVFLDNGLDTDTVDFCTNDACPGDLGNPWMDDPLPVKELGVDTIAVGFMPLPGEYTATLEATDMHGNTSEIATITFSVEAPPTGGTDGTGGSDGDGTAGPGDGGVFTAGSSGDGDGDGSGGSAADGDDSSGGGCSCTTAPTDGGLTLLALGLFGFGFATRRRR